MKNILIIILQVFVFIIVSPLLSGLISKIKNNIRMRKGQSVFQPYYNLVKLFFKDEVIPHDASWIFSSTPVIVLSAMLSAALFVPIFIIPAPMHHAADFLAIIFIFALGRFFLALSALDTGSSFGGMGSSREMFISSLSEPALCLVIFSVLLQTGSTDISLSSGAYMFPVSSVITAVTLFLITIAETSRVPVDNQETHLELTMVHEAIVLEYSGRSLALLEMASYVKQMAMFFLIAQIIFPIALPVLTGYADILYWILWYITRIIIIVVAVSLLEISIAKMRLFRVADFLGFTFVLGIISVVCAVLGV